MATWLEQRWEPRLEAPGRRQQQGGRFLAYQPDVLTERSLALDAQVAARAADVERAVRS